MDNSTSRVSPPLARSFIGPLLVALVGASLTAALFAYVRYDVERDAKLRFERRAADAKHIIERRLRAYVGVTYGLRALFAAREQPNRAEFHRYVESLDLARNYPGFEVLNYARHVRGVDKAAFERAARRDAPPEVKFSIKPPGERPEHHVLVYLAPLKGNEFALGLDIAATPVRAKAIYEIRDSGELISSGRIVNVKGGYIALAMRLAVYRYGAPIDTVEQRRAAFIGTVGTGYNMRKLMAGVLDETTMTAMRYRLSDAGPLGAAPAADAKPSLLFDSAQTAAGAPTDDFSAPGQGELFETVLPLEIARRNWELHFSAPKRHFLERTDAVLPAIVLAGGLLCTTLLFALVYAFASSRERAKALAAEITRELRESEASLAHAQSLARLGSWTLDSATQSMTWSAETYRILGLDPGATAPSLAAFLSWFDDAGREHFGQALETCLRKGAPCSLELPLQRRGETETWAHLVLQPEGNQVRGTIMDVTERKRALETQRANAAQIRDLLRRLVSVQEAERRRFSANLHDLVGQSLSVIGIGLETIRGMLPGSAARGAEAAIGDMGQVVKETMGAVREVMSDLRPPLLDDYGLGAALEWHAQQLEARTGLRVQVEGGKLAPRAAAEVEMALFRIAQEALTNVAKHAGASQARVALSMAAGRMTMVVEDDGRGIAGAPAANDPGAGSWGMAVMRERALSVGGAMRVESPGRGTRIVVEVNA